MDDEYYAVYSCLSYQGYNEKKRERVVHIAFSGCRDLSADDERLDQRDRYHERGEDGYLPAFGAFGTELVGMADENDVQSHQYDDTHRVGKYLSGDEQEVFCVEVAFGEECYEADPYQHDHRHGKKDPFHV